MSVNPILVLGADGYTGWPLVCRLLDHGYNVVGVDSLEGRSYRGESVTPITEHNTRSEVANTTFKGTYHYEVIDITDYNVLGGILSKHDPATVVNLAQIPSAPYSMANHQQAWEVQRNNILGSLNLMWALKSLNMTDTHVVQLATMGEYPLGEDIPEGWTDKGQPAPKRPGSLYHASKVNTTANTLFLSQTWGIPVTEIYQGIVYGVSTDSMPSPSLQTRFDCDSVFGTVLNRFTAQAAVDHPLTVYGKGGQKRAMLPLQDCVRCLQLVIENPPMEHEAGTNPYRPVNQFQSAYRVNELAEMVSDYTGAEIQHIDNPRDEDETEHVYEPDRHVLDALGYEPTQSILQVFEETYDTISDKPKKMVKYENAPRPD